VTQRAGELGIDPERDSLLRSAARAHEVCGNVLYTAPIVNALEGMPANFCCRTGGGRLPAYTVTRISLLPEVYPGIG
jgi:hypothetical protein